MENLHFSQLISAQRIKYGAKTALCSREKITDNWNEISWIALEESVNSIAKAFVEIGLQEHQNVAQFSQNRAENLIVDFALFANRAVVVPLYATSTVQQVEFIVNDAEIETIFVGDQTQYNVANEVLKRSEFLKRIIVFDNAVKFDVSENALYYADFKKIGDASSKHFEVEHRQNEASETDLACLLYTSGTTANPKGVMLPHSCFSEAVRLNTLKLSSVSENDTSLAFLPLSHVFERTWCYLCLSNGINIYINLLPSQIQQAIVDVHPTIMCAVPRFWEKVYAGVQENISKFSPFMQGVVTWALAIGRKYNFDCVRLGKRPSLYLALRYKLADKLIFSKVKGKLGIENGNIFPTAGAKLSDDISLFFRSIGVPIVYGYGLTESTATVSCYDYTGYEIGTVGGLVPEVEVKIGKDNEILLKGRTIFPGYYKNPEANKAAFDEDGWFKTGDVGTLNGRILTMTERIKDLFKTSNGKYIAPQIIETKLNMDKYIEFAAVIGDERNFVTAIIVPVISAIEEYARSLKIQYTTIEELIANPLIVDLITLRIKEQQAGMAEYEKVKRFTLIPNNFSIEAGELTNTLKVRRAVIMQKYKLQIDAMYSF